MAIQSEEESLSTKLGMDIPEIRSELYHSWILDTASRLKKELPFEGPADITIVLGSGLDELWQGFELQGIKHIKDKDLGLPVGKTQGHDYEWIAGIAGNDKKILIKSGRVGAIEPNPLGTDTKMGKLSNVDMATAYLRVLDEIGTDILITTHASGGIAQPRLPGERVPFQQAPQIALISNNIDDSFSHPLLGPKFDSRRHRFPSPRYSDENLMSTFEKALSVSHNLKFLERVVYYTSRTSPEFEDEAYIQKVLSAGGGVFGMSLGPEKRVIDDCQNINRFINLAVVTNPVQLRFKAGNDELFAVRRRLNNLGWHLPIKEAELGENELIPSALDLNPIWTAADRLYKTEVTNHEEVMEFGRKANGMLKSGLEAIIGC